MPLEATVGVGISPRWERAVDEALDACGPLIEPPELALVYLTDYLANDAEGVRRRVLERTGAAALAGTVGLGVCATGREVMDEPGVVVMLLRGVGAATRVLRLPPAAGSAAAPHDGAVALVHCDPWAGLPGRDKRSPLAGAFLVGGVTGSRMQSVQLHTGGTMTRGVSAVVLDPALPVTCGVSQGCAPLGPYHRVTEAADQILVSLDGRPALEVLREDVGPDRAGDVEALGRSVFVAAPLPHRDTRDERVRHLVGYDAHRGALAVAHHFRAGDDLRFVRRDAESARADLVRVLGELRGRHPGAPRAALYFSCVARGANLFGAPGVELELIAEHLGDLPLAGFFGQGEISNDQVYGYTGVLVLLG